MTKKKRTILFIGLGLLFFIIAPLSVFYSLGWRFNFENKKIVQVGAIYIKSWPLNSQIYIDGKPKKRTDMCQYRIKFSCGKKCPAAIPKNFTEPDTHQIPRPAQKLIFLPACDEFQENPVPPWFELRYCCGRQNDSEQDRLSPYRDRSNHLQKLANSNRCSRRPQYVYQKIPAAF